MSSFNFFFLCLQACFIHLVPWYSWNTYGLEYGAGSAPAAALGPGFAIPGAYGLGLAPAIAEFLAAIEMGAYVGAGIGDVAVAGEMPVAGTTLVAREVPILGAVRFAGDLPAAGTVSISGSCGCGGGAYLY